MQRIAARRFYSTEFFRELVYRNFLGTGKPCTVAMDARATNHFWAVLLKGCDHKVRLTPPIQVKPFVKRPKDDAADAAAIVEAALRQDMRFVDIERVGHQARAVHSALTSASRQRTQLINALRGLLGEFGIVVAQGPASLGAVSDILADETNDLPKDVRKIDQLYLDQLNLLTEKIYGLMLKLRNATKANEDMRRLRAVPGAGPVAEGATLALAPYLRTFKSGRDFDSWLGLVPRQHSTGGKTRVAASARWDKPKSASCSSWEPRA